MRKSLWPRARPPYLKRDGPLAGRPPQPGERPLTDQTKTDRAARPDPRARMVQELEQHLGFLDTFTGAALGVLAVASGIYTYLGVQSLLDGDGAMQAFAAIAYSIAVSTGIFVFWSYLMRLFPAMRTARSRAGLMGALGLGSLAIVAMSSWLNAAALAGGAAVEQHLAETVQDYQAALERANENALAAQGLERDVARVQQSFADLSEQEASGGLSGLAGRGAVFRVLRQKSEELAALQGADRRPVAPGRRRLRRGQRDP